MPGAFSLRGPGGASGGFVHGGQKAPAPPGQIVQISKTEKMPLKKTTALSIILGEKEDLRYTETGKIAHRERPWEDPGRRIFVLPEMAGHFFLRPFPGGPGAGGAGLAGEEIRKERYENGVKKRL